MLKVEKLVIGHWPLAWLHGSRQLEAEGFGISASQDYSSLGAQRQIKDALSAKSEVSPF